MNENLIKKLKKEKVSRIYSLSRDVVEAFEKKCKEKGVKYSRVVEYLLTTFK